MKALGYIVVGVLATLCVLAPPAMAGLAGGGLQSGAAPVTGTTITPAIDAPTVSANFAIDIPIKVLDHSGNGYWAISNQTVTAQGNNLDNLVVTRTGGITPYFRVDLTNGDSISRFGFAVGAVNDELLVPVVHGTATVAQAIEANSGAMTAGALAVTFATAFSVAPKCQCTHINTTNTNGCTISSAAVPTTTGVTFAVLSGGTDVVHWFCVGAR